MREGVKRKGCRRDAFGDIQSSCTSTMLVQAMAYWIMIGFGDNTIRIPVGNQWHIVLRIFVFGDICTIIVDLVLFVSH